VTDPIVAPATAWGRSPLAVVRLTGSGLDPILAAVLTGSQRLQETPRRVGIRSANGTPIDDGLAWLRRGPRTATGQDLCEITVHGNPLIVEALVQACLSAGARTARPGEFTRRAVLGGHLDLVRAEAVDQVIRATSPGGLDLARTGMDGRLSRRLQEWHEALLASAADLEARLDYPDDELTLASDDELIRGLWAVSVACAALAETYDAGRALVDGVRIALVGPVNAGKSSLFNRLVGSERALVHAQPGTTRDVVEARCQLGPLQATLLDTAGERSTEDPVEAAGLALAQRLVADTDLLVVVLRAGRPTAADPVILARTAAQRRVVVYNGLDQARGVPDGALGTSAVTGEGLDALQDAIVAQLGVADTSELLVASARQRDALQAISAAAQEAVTALPVAGPAVAADALTRGLEQLDVLTGADTREEVLDALFARFCIGK